MTLVCKTCHQNQPTYQIFHYVISGKFYCPTVPSAESLFCPAKNNKKMETLTEIQEYQSANSRLAIKDIRHLSAGGGGSNLKPTFYCWKVKLAVTGFPHIQWRALSSISLPAIMNPNWTYSRSHFLTTLLLVRGFLPRYETFWVLCHWIWENVGLLAVENTLSLTNDVSCLAWLYSNRTGRWNYVF